MNSYLANLGPGLANHLWQSTAFAVVDWLLTLALRRNQARIRYAIWLAASVKFLVSFSLLVAAGNLLPHPKQPVVPMVYSAIDVVEEPFADVAPQAAPAVHVPTVQERIAAVLPVSIGVLWALGAGVVMVVFAFQWRQVRRTLISAESVVEGREFAILRRLEARFAGRKNLELRLSRERMEPGVFGGWRQVLVWPRAFSAQLADEHIEAILAHELIHVRRRDNLTATLHMLVETLFWFHPMVWWMERRMVREREQACDEAVVDMGGDAGVYAESLLKTVRFCVESPLVCISGVTGGELKQRVVGIVTGRALLRLSWPKKLLLGTTSLCALTGPIMLGIAQEKAATPVAHVYHPTPPLPSYDVATIKPADPSKPNTGVTIRQYIAVAYNSGTGSVARMDGPPPPQTIGGPEWIDKDRYIISGKPSDELRQAMQSMNSDQRMAQYRMMEQSLLAERFHLKVHFETREMPVYELVPAKGGLKIKPVDAPLPNEPPRPGAGTMPPGGIGLGIGPGGGGMINARAIPMSTFIDAVRSLADELGARPIVDKTGFTGYFDVDHLRWAGLPTTGTSPSRSADADTPSLSTALEQLGLRLTPAKGQVEVVVIDSIDRPSEN